MAYTILIVDDEKDLRDALVYDFHRRKYHTLEASSGEEALHLIETQKVDAVISDIRMPHGDGMQLLEMLKAKNIDLPLVLLVTGYTGISEAEALKKGAIGILAKPIDRNKMFEMLERATRKKLSA